MNDQNLFDNLRRRFTASGVSPAYADRLIEELQLHLKASVDTHLLRGLPTDQAESAALATFGTEQQILQTTLNTLRRESFIGRHRILSMILAPLILLSATRFLVFSPLFDLLTVRRIGTYFIRGGYQLIDGRTVINIQEFLFNLLVPLAFTFGLWKLGRRKFCGRVYTIAGCSLLMACSLNFQMMHYPGGTPPPHTSIPSIYQTILLSLYALPLFAWLMRRNNDSQNQPAVH